MKFVIFHGAFGSASSNWFPWLKIELEKLNQQVILEQFPIDDYEVITKNGPNIPSKNQNLPNWFKIFEKNILPKINKGDKLIFIGHSLAPVFILHLIDKYNLKLELGIFVSPFSTFLNKKDIWQFDHVNSSFYKTDFDFRKLKKLILNSYVIYGDDDPYVDKKYPIDLARKLDSKIIVIKKGKHLNDEFGYKKFPLLLENIKTFIKKNS